MQEKEKYFQQLLRTTDPEVDRPLIAADYAHWLINEKRYRHAASIIYAALKEGSRFDLYELTAMSNLTDLEDLWKKVHKKMHVPPEKYGAEVYNEGLKEGDPDWEKVLSKIAVPKAEVSIEKVKSWNFSGLNVTLKENKLLWENWRRGCEGGSEQSAEEFLEKGPFFDFNEVPRSVLREIIQALGHVETKWLAEEGKEKSVSLTIQGMEAFFVDDQSLRAYHSTKVENILKKYTLPAQEYWKEATLYAGLLTKDVQIGNFTYKAYTELYLHENGNVFIGHLAKATTLNGVHYAANARIIFNREGLVESVND